MNVIRNKLRSSRGASITYALLIFLVCAVVSAVVIVAATTSSGRMSELAAMDQRYYAVTSAAELLKDTELLCDVFVAPSTTQPPEVTLTYKTSDGSVTTDTTITDVLVLDADERLAKALVTRTDAAPVVLNLTSEGNDPLSCKITETVYSNGLLEFAISNVDTKNAYGEAAVFRKTEQPRGRIHRRDADCAADLRAGAGDAGRGGLLRGERRHEEQEGDGGVLRGGRDPGPKAGKRDGCQCHKGLSDR